MDRAEGMRVARLAAIAAVFFAVLGLLSAGNTYRAEIVPPCRVAPYGLVLPGLAIFFFGGLAALLVLGIAVFEIGTALAQRQWAWTAILVVTLVLGLIAVLGDDAPLSRQAVGVAFGNACGFLYPAVTALAALVGVSVVELAYVLVHGSAGDGERAA